MFGCDLDFAGVIQHTGSTLSVYPVSKQFGTLYRFRSLHRVRRCFEQYDSLTVTLIDNYIPTIIEQPESITTSFWLNCIILRSCIKSIALNYQWRKNGVDIPSANSSVYTIQSVTLSDIAQYDCVVSNTSGSLFQQ